MFLYLRLVEIAQKHLPLGVEKPAEVGNSVIGDFGQKWGIYDPVTRLGCDEIMTGRLVEILIQKLLQIVSRRRIAEFGEVRKHFAFTRLCHHVYERFRVLVDVRHLDRVEQLWVCEYCAFRVEIELLQGSLRMQIINKPNNDNVLEIWSEKVLTCDLIFAFAWFREFYEI